MDLPSIVTNINGCNEIIIENKNGLIVKPKDVNELYVAMDSLISNKELYKELTLNSRKMIVERFEQHILWDKILKEYQSLR